MFSKLSSELELVALYPLTVQEGGVAVITTQNIDVVLDHHKYGVRPSGVLLHVAQSPMHGKIAVDLSLQRNVPQYTNHIDGEKAKQFFTLMDLSRDKVCMTIGFISRHCIAAPLGLRDHLRISCCLCPKVWPIGYGI